MSCESVSPLDLDTDPRFYRGSQAGECEVPQIVLDIAEVREAGERTQSRELLMIAWTGAHWSLQKIRHSDAMHLTPHRAWGQAKMMARELLEIARAMDSLQVSETGGGHVLAPAS